MATLPPYDRHVPLNNPEKVLTHSTTFTIVPATETVVTIQLAIRPAVTGRGKGRIVHPLMGSFDYETKPDVWTNMDEPAPLIIPAWKSVQTLTNAANTLWIGNITDVIVEEQWTAQGGISMPITQLRMLLAVWTNPLDPDVGYVHWYPNYATDQGFKVLPVNLTAGGQGIALDDVTNYKDEDDNPTGWVTSPVTFQLKLVEAL